MLPLPCRDIVAKTGFAISLLVLGFLYGFAANTFELFPNTVLERAWEQYKVVSPFRHKMRSLSPRVYDRTGTRTAQPDLVQPGVTLIASVWKDFDWKPGVKLIDMDGQTLHQWILQPARLFPGWTGRRNFDLEHRYIHGTYLLPDGGLVANIEYVGTVRLDACGNIVWRLPNTHHSIDRTDDGTFWIPVTNPELQHEGRNQPEMFRGLEGPRYDESLVHVNDDGEVLDSLDVLQVLYENGLERHIWKSHSTGPDVMHLNDIESLSGSMAEEYPLFDAGDLLVSLRNLDLVFVVDPQTRRVKWHTTDQFIEQHDADFLGERWIGVFDNNRDGTFRGTILGGSRIIAIQPRTDSTIVLFPKPRSEGFYTRAMGKWQQLENGNLLLTESRAGRIVEVTTEGRTVWEWVTGLYDESRVPEVSEGTRYDLTAEDVASWPCSRTGRGNNR